MQKSVRVITAADLDIADTITVVAYQAPESRKAELQRYLALQPDGWHLAFLDEQPAGFGGITNYGLFSYIGMVGVLPAMQRHGLGAFIMQSLLSWAEQRDCPTILLDASDAGVHLYDELGFVEDDKTLLLSLLEPLAQPANRPAHVSELQEHEIPELAAFDALYFGANRARVFQHLFHEFPRRAFVSRGDNGSIAGYLFAQSRVLGPWAAQTPADAEGLLLSALSLPFGPILPNVMISSAHQQGFELLQRYGFRPRRQLSHMRLGPLLPRQRTMIYGQASLGLG
jgi:GNAT superfamily N-acetyltransferase